MWQHMLWVGLLMAGTALFAQAWALSHRLGALADHGLHRAHPVQIGHVLAIRSERDSLFRQGVWSNRPLFARRRAPSRCSSRRSTSRSCTPIFKTAAAERRRARSAWLLSAVVFVAVEIEKWLVRRGWLYQPSPVAVRPRFT